jgi:hypothetical protein
MKRLSVTAYCVALAAALGVVSIAGPLPERKAQSDPGLVAHEWGTFTSIAGVDGQPVIWLPVDLTSSDLPNFVEHMAQIPSKAVLRGRVRMETPVLYFYTNHETTVSVHVSFSQGLITEWYPHAVGMRPASWNTMSPTERPYEDGSVTWDTVRVSPSAAADFPWRKLWSHYYEARATTAAPVTVRGLDGDEHEKFLFYRGVSSISLPISANVLPSGAVQLDNRTGQPIPALILFERRGDQIGYQVVTSPQDRLTLDTPSVSGSVDSLRRDLEDILVAQGLYQDEAQAMLKTWGESWFAEGSRLFYIVPRKYVDSILPLSISPATAQIARVFVGRIELVTPATERSIETALAAHDRSIVRKYGRFFSPILDIMLAKESDPQRRERLNEDFRLSLQSSAASR